jgi:membrane protein DedA with SNARE-associated domain
VLRVARVRGWFEQRAPWLMVGFRFVYGIRNVAPFAIGSFGVKAKVFTPLNALGALIWAPLFTWLGYSFGLLISTAFARAHKYEEYIMGVLALAGIVIAVSLAIKRRSTGLRK